MSSVGALLRDTRQKKKLSLEDASRATNIKKELLEALENDDYEKVPAPTYVKGFLKIYSSYLGLEPDEVVGEYLKDHVGNSEQVLVLDVEGRVKPRQPRHIARFAVIGGAAVVVIALLFLAIKGIMRWRPARAPEASPQMEILEPATLTVEETDLAQPVKPAPPHEMELRLKAVDEDVWVKVVADGVTVFQNVVKKGGEEFWKGKDGFTMRLGRPEAVSLTLDGNPITIPGRKTKPRTISIDAEGNIEFSK